MTVDANRTPPIHHRSDAMERVAAGFKAVAINEANGYELTANGKSSCSRLTAPALNNEAELLSR